MSPQQPIIAIRDLSTFFGSHCIHKDLNLDIYPSDITAIVGGSGAGKTTLLRNILMLQRPTSGTITIQDNDITQAESFALRHLQTTMGVMFQQGALFSSLTVLENVAFPLKLHTKMPIKIINELARLKISLVGLPLTACHLYPAELSGGMIKRAAVARALALDPTMLFLDEPTAGLDPKGAADLDSLILELRHALDLSIIIVTHDLDTLWRITDRVAFLGEGRVLKVDSMQALAHCEIEAIENYFSGPRGRIAEAENTARDTT